VRYIVMVIVVGMWSKVTGCALQCYDAMEGMWSRVTVRYVNLL
jgi:hypothetical protein